MIKSLGQLSREQKEDIWKNKISGSQIKRITKDTENLFLEKTGQKEIIDLSKTKAAKYLAAGTYMEDHIFNMGVEVFEELANAKIDKDTFESELDPYYTANIDGYIGKDIHNVEAIIEIKNTQEEDLLKVANTYEDQIRYYMNFFDAPKAYLLVFVKGNELKLLTIEKSEWKEEKIVKNIELLKSAVEANDFSILEPLQAKDDEFVKVDIDLSQDDTEDILEDLPNTFDGTDIDEIREAMENFTYAKAQAKTSKALEDAAKKELTDLMDEKKLVGKIVLKDGTKVNRMVVNNKGKVNQKAMLEEIAMEHGVDLLALQDKHTGSKYQTKQFRVSIPKGDK